jgi:hypothetical protein
MPRQLTTPEESQSLDQERLELHRQLEEIDRALVAYDPEGPWKYISEQLEGIANGALDALTRCDLGDVRTHRGAYNVARNLLTYPDLLRETRARLQEELNDG